MLKKIKDYFTKDEEYEEKEENEREYKINKENSKEINKKEYDDYEEFKNYEEDNENLEDEKFLLSDNSQTKKCEVILVSPNVFNDALKIANDLKKNRMIILNLEDIEFEEGRKIVDFLSGTVYALGGSVNKISGKIILLVPIFVDVQNTISLRGKESGIDIPDFR